MDAKNVGNYSAEEITIVYYVPKNCESRLEVDKVTATINRLTFLAHPVLPRYF